MEYFTRVRKPLYQPLQVRYFKTDRFAYDGLGLPANEFAERIDFDLDTLLIDEPDPDSSAFFQQAVFFAPLIECFKIFEIPFQLEDFVRTDEDGDQFITTVALHDYFQGMVIQEWDERNSLPAAGRQDRIDRLMEFMTGLSIFMFHVKPAPAVDGPTWDLVILTLRALQNALSWTYVIEHDVVFDLPPRFNLLDFTSARPRLLDEKLSKNCCIRERLILGKLFDKRADILYMCSQLDHGFDASAHSRCSLSVCEAYQVDEEVYRTQHRPQTCDDDCTMMHSTQIVSRLYENPTTGFIANLMIEFPVIRMRDGNIVVLKYKTFAARSTALPNKRQPFVAISHVWADGLGNTQGQNSLPTCQLNWIQLMVNKLYPADKWPVPFWIDSLCVPTKPSLRKQAIKQMRLIYAAATKVLVLDKTLLATDTGDLSSEEIGLRILTSPWSRRLWTLQEGAQRTRVTWQFADRSLDFAALHEEMNRKFTSGFSERSCTQNPVLYQILDQASELKVDLSRCNARGASIYKTAKFERYTKVPNVCWPQITGQLQDMHVFDEEIPFDRGRLLQHISSAMIHRTTSKLVDETACMLSLMSTGWQLSVEDILQLPREEHYRKLFETIHHMPEAIVFYDQRRYEEYGSRWIPKSLLSQSNPRCEPITWEARSRGMDRKRGVSVEWPGLELLCRDDSQPLPQRFLVQVEDKLWRVNCFEAGTQSYPSGGIKGTMVLIIRTKEHLYRPNLSYEAALVSIINRNPFYVRHEALARISYHGRDPDAADSETASVEGGAEQQSNTVTLDPNLKVAAGGGDTMSVVLSVSDWFGKRYEEMSNMLFKRAENPTGAYVNAPVMTSTSARLSSEHVRFGKEATDEYSSSCSSESEIDRSSINLDRHHASSEDVAASIPDPESDSAPDSVCVSVSAESSREEQTNVSQENEDGSDDSEDFCWDGVPFVTSRIVEDTLWTVG